jgi:hypothetical protein
MKFAPSQASTPNVAWEAVLTARRRKACEGRFGLDVASRRATARRSLKPPASDASARPGEAWGNQAGDGGSGPRPTVPVRCGDRGADCSQPACPSTAPPAEPKAA